MLAVLSMVFMLLMLASASFEAHKHSWIGFGIFMALALWDFYMLMDELAADGKRW